MKSIALNIRTPLTMAVLSAALALAACGKKEDTTTMPSTPANTAPTVTTPMPDTGTTSPAPMGGSSGSMGSTPSSGSMGSSTGTGGGMGNGGGTGSGMTTSTPGAATGSIPNNDASPAVIAPASASR